ncbi:MAG TPA: DUF4097 family beta strand repeat-containing protein [Vicinamibacterales bacterium]|jgi:hypothetical protein|nr:DUF4097 family beta strand repeat-containing protein [Vicinamibacterales bacterium]
MRYRTLPARRFPRTLALLGAPALLVALAPLAACNLQLSTDVEAKDQWTRSYPLTPTGQLIINSSNGGINVTAGDGDTVTVTAERIVKAGTEDVAKQQLALFEMKEDVKPDRVSIDSTSRGIMMNVSRRVNYTVTMPKGASLSLVNSNGEIVVTNIGGHFSAETSNGSVTATGLKQSAKVSTTNGVIDLGFESVSGEGIAAETTNGMITLSLPNSTNADFSARVTNGAIERDNLTLQVSEESRRRLDGRMGTGGARIRLETTNGAITVRGR